MEEVKCLGIESTAHTFSSSIVRLKSLKEGEILSNVRSIYTPPKGSGIHPTEASRHHTKVAPAIMHSSLKEAKLTMKDIDVIAYSAGPGLGPCLRVGATIARALASYYNKPIVPTNHAIGHIELGCFLTGLLDPLVLLISGGHTLITAYAGKRWRIFGETLDLTIGQILDQFGRELGYSSPAGSIIEELASNSKNYILMPYTVKGNDVSFSGLLTYAKKLLAKGYKVEDICYSLQETAFAMLCETFERAIAFCEKREAMVVGGVAANKRLSSMVNSLADRYKINLKVVPMEYSGDCGAQIAVVGALAFKAGYSVGVEKSLVRRSWRIDDVEIFWRD
ncbi:MAG: KEOPS complex N(6)-L-threonylcarbamoyladenine synthase Kae1 [Nitrososphaerales archaeon]